MLCALLSRKQAFFAPKHSLQQSTVREILHRLAESRIDISQIGEESLRNLSAVNCLICSLSKQTYKSDQIGLKTVQ